MRNIYEKTLALLFRGQKNVANNNAPALQGIINYKMLR